MWQVSIILTDREWNKEKVLSSELFSNRNEALKYFNVLVNNISELSISVYTVSFLLDQIKEKK